jgi:23S rRNA pseudouridine1911/1915/1917 synthase
MTPQHFLFEVAAEDSGTRLDKYLTAHLPELSRSQLQRLIQEGQVGLAQGVVTASYRVRGGDIITLDVPPPRPARPVAEALALQIVYEDDALLVIDKPPGLVVHPSPGHASGTLVNALLFHCQMLSGIGGEERPGIVHRLDKDTSGLLLVAKHDRSHRHLSAQLQTRQLQRRLWPWCVDDSQHCRALLRHRLDAIPSIGKRWPSSSATVGLPAPTTMW